MSGTSPTISLVRRTLCGALAAVSLAALGLAAGPAAAEEVVNVYTTREPALAAPLFEAFTKATGVRVHSVFVKDGLAERVKAEGAASPADVLMTVDVGNLLDVVDAGVTQPVETPVLTAAVPANLRDPQGNWYALSLRARLVYAAKDAKLTGIHYEDLADPKYKGKICIRSGQHPYNVALTAAYLVHHGEAKTEAWLRGVKANLARKATGGDREGARDIVGGICELAIGNSYYVGLMRSGKGGPEQQKWGDGIAVLLPTFEGGGTHVNVSGAAVAKNAPNKSNAVKLLEFAVSPEMQAIYAKANFEYPVLKGAAIDPVIAALGPLTVDPISLVDIAKARKKASELIDKVGFDS
ncbi:extracellular solute-binding protein [Aquabacter spiritensis]|uniref:Iron(III) transport system substrate-binding protein n=1 Tax=Aquabacter spiritensis TaxID=933073 RepID=A0A4R3LMN9_9HYPH|nr:extracellular solute-binding protein [Aquabacter spiritensis]TCT01584.1 iron(III) transport system substrate-binding protein [Aquabacter spiritensis]